MTTLIYVVIITFIWILGLLFVERLGYKREGTKGLITNQFREAVKSQPWIFILLALITGFMMGHCFGQ